MYNIDLIEVNNQEGKVLADLSGRALKRKIVKRRNAADTIYLSFDIYNLRKYAESINTTILDIFAVNKNEIIIKKNDVVVAAGQVIWVNPRISNSAVIDIVAVGWFDLLGQRYTGESVEFTQEDAGEIAWSLIEISQNKTFGDFGITKGIIQESKLRDRTYENKNIKDAIIQLSEVIDGFDFEITWDKKFNIYYPKIGHRRDDLVFNFPGNIKELSFERDGLKIANNVTAVGSGTGVNTIRAISENLTSQERFYLRERVVQHPDVSREETLQQHADSEIMFKSAFLDIPEIIVSGESPQFGTYGIGDEIRIQTEELQVFEPVNGWWRIDEITLDLDENNHEDIKLRVMR